LDNLLIFGAVHDLARRVQLTGGEGPSPDGRRVMSCCPSVADRDRIDAIAASILEHLRRFPDARDTARGVHDWWLAPCLRDASLAAVERALRRLVAARRVVAVVMPDGSTLFANPPERPGHPPTP
jgi:hypothetical protein